LSALDLLASSNLVNYFGQSENIDCIRIYPILIEKAGLSLLPSLIVWRVGHEKGKGNLSANSDAAQRGLTERVAPPRPSRRAVSARRA